MPFAKVVEPRAIISSSFKKCVELLFMLHWIANELHRCTKVLLRRDFNDLECLPTNVLSKYQAASLAPPTFA
jgi:hypothetical protein